jgi:hypothetical protein
MRYLGSRTLLYCLQVYGLWTKSMQNEFTAFLSFHLVLIQLSSSHCSLCLLPLAHFLPDQYEKGLRQRNERSEMVAACLRAAVKLGLSRFSDQMEDSQMGTGYSGRRTPVKNGPKLGFSGSISSLIGF